MNKSQLEQAWAAGAASIKNNKDRNKLLDLGVKQIEVEQNFEDWYFNMQAQSLTTQAYSFDKSAKTANKIIEGYSELTKLNKNPVGAAQLLNAMEKYHKLMKQD